MADIGCYSFSNGFDYTIPPFLKDIEFWFWKARMTSFIKAFDFDMWDVFMKDFDFKPRRDWDETERKMFCLNLKAMKILYSAVTENDFKKIRLCSSAKDIWDTLDSLYASNDDVEIESVISSSDYISYMSPIDEQMEDEIEEGEIVEYFHESTNNDEQENEKEDSQEELIINEFDESCPGAQESHLVNNSNSSYGYRKTDFDILHKLVFQPVIDSVLKNKTVLNHAGNIVGKKECSSMHVPHHHNTCSSIHVKFDSITCNYCGKSGHISHTCRIRRNYNVRNKYVWVPKGQIKSKSNNQGPKAKWVPKCPSVAFRVQFDSKRNGHKGTEKKKNEPRVFHASRKRFYESTSRMDYQKGRILLAPRSRSPKFEYHRKMQWVSKANLPHT